MIGLHRPACHDASCARFALAAGVRRAYHRVALQNPTDILHAAGLRRTPVRTGVIDVLTRASRPHTVLEIVTHLPKGTDTVTVYRTLNTLVSKKLARRVRGEDRSWLFELVDASHHQQHVHAHFVCDECGTVECLQDVAVPTSVPHSAKLQKGYEVTKQEVTLHGVCPKCH
jgi:Fur family transcriptional regulator, ferric uptake regulator